MPEVFVLPYHLVDHFTNPGLDADAGIIPMNQYMSKTRKNGGNDNCHDLFKNLRWMKDAAIVLEAVLLRSIFIEVAGRFDRSTSGATFCEFAHLNVPVPSQ
ncbi:MAG TPA: hypothetical protein VF240_06650 [Pyrinomonadaceae bacterium]